MLFYLLKTALIAASKFQSTKTATCMSWPQSALVYSQTQPTPVPSLSHCTQPTHHCHQPWQRRIAIYYTRGILIYKIFDKVYILYLRWFRLMSLLRLLRQVRKVGEVEMEEAMSEFNMVNESISKVGIELIGQLKSCFYLFDLFDDQVVLYST